MAVIVESFEELSDTFLLFCRTKGLSKGTIECYEYALGRLGEFLATKEEKDLSKPILREYVTYLLESGLARHTIGIRLRAVRTFCNLFLAIRK